MSWLLRKVLNAQNAHTFGFQELKTLKNALTVNAEIGDKMTQIKRFLRITKYLGFWLEPYLDYQERVNAFCKTVKVITINTIFVSGRITHFVVYEDAVKPL